MIQNLQNLGRIANTGGGQGSGDPLFVSQVGEEATPGSTGSSSFTGTGFTPKCLMTAGTVLTGEDNSTDARYGFGIATAANAEAAHFMTAQSGLATSDTNRRHDNTVSTLSPTTAGLIGADAEFTSFDANGFTRNWENVPGTAEDFNHILLGGKNLEANLIKIVAPTGTGTQTYAHGLSSAPTALVAFWMGANNNPPNSTGNLRGGMGLWAGTNHVSVSLNSNDGVTTTAARRYASNTKLLTHIGLASVQEASVDSVDATNITLDWTSNDNDGRHYWILAITGVSAQVGVHNPASGTGDKEITCTGINPKLFLTMSSLNNMASELGTVVNHATFALGASDGTNQFVVGFSDRDSRTTTEAYRWQHQGACYEYRSVTNSRGALATASFESEKVVMNFSQNDNANFDEHGYLILGTPV